MWKAALLSLCLLVAPAGAATRLFVTVVDEKTLQPVEGLGPQDFQLLDDKTVRPIASVEVATSKNMDVMLLVDASLLGEAVKPVASNLIEQLEEGEQMAIVAFDSSANLVRDFTSSHQLLQQAVAGLKYGNAPRALDAVFAAVDGGFHSSSFRRVILLVTTGIEGPSRMRDEEVIRAAQRAGVSVYPIFISGEGKYFFRALAEQTGATYFNLRNLSKQVPGEPGPHIFKVARNQYMLTLQGNPMLSSKLKLKLNRPGKYIVSLMPQI
jgi:VWFA-related protein